MTERERRALLRRRPEVLSWTSLLMSARERYDSSGADSVGTRRGRASA
jgi:WhiB family redox-sensing transcriptional regulator